ncbi:MAG TPA: type I glyceraldehyde-3-phosphate dehydrogenase [Myxococcota bacterium]|nr:type I glyceraldehyde-3-phosphate dehydrogenase [Myxococcota bacterium]
MPVRVAINGFGRIGRCVVRAGWNRSDIEFVHINDLTDDTMLAYLLAHDSVHGRWGVPVEVVDGGMRIGDRVIPTSAEKDASKLPWAALGVDVVLECTGVMTSKDKASAHLAAGAKRVIISAPGTNVDGTFVMGVNHTDFDPAVHTVVSNASCTTNCLAPVAKVLHEAFGIEHGLMTTVHSYTMDQNLLDAPHRKGDPRRARAAAVNMVPSSTGAAKAIGLVLPALSGRLDGMSMRVPTPNGSIIDLVCQVSRDTTREEVNALLAQAAAGPLAGVLEVRDEPLVSSDIIGNPASSIVDAELTQVRGGRMVKVMSWYDNEWGFSNRMLDLVAWMSRPSEQAGA